MPTTEVAELEPDDPWAPIYAATLGVLPRQLDEGLQKHVGPRQVLPFGEIVPVEYTPVTGSLDDLVARLGETRTRSPRQLAGVALATGLKPDSSVMRPQPALPSPGHERREAGPNIIVAVSEGSAADIALLWNLRGAHGDWRAMPIGLPAGQVTRTALTTCSSLASRPCSASPGAGVG
ncbi:MAG TPA: hypothetical protein VG253_25805 [Streptosporangiaceae bacterium]|nr:hypothetical protein [Streptosporangiaceae bacterium]